MRKIRERFVPQRTCRPVQYQEPARIPPVRRSLSDQFRWKLILQFSRAHEAWVSKPAGIRR